MKTLKIAAVAALALGLSACSKNPVNQLMGAADSSDLQALRTSVEEARAAAIQANENARYARELAEQNAEKINRSFRKSQYK